MKNNEELFLENKYIVEVLVRRVCYNKKNMDDLLQVGYLALLKAIEKYDVKKEVKLSSFSTKYILGSIYKELKFLNQEVILKENDYGLIENIKSTENLENNYINSSLDKLEKKEKEVIKHKIYGNFTNKDISKKFKISESMVTKIYKEGLVKLKKIL